MQTTTAPAGNQASFGSEEDPAASLMSIVADMMSLIIHVQASTRLIETEIKRNRGDDGSETADIVILDDVTPCYTAAHAALSACNAGLDAALQSLLGTLSEARKTHPREERT